MLKNEIVEVRKGEIFTTSKIIADKLEVPHAKLIGTIERLLKKVDTSSGMYFSQRFIEKTFVNRQKAEYKGYLINEPAFIKLVMQLGRYEKALIIQNEVIEAFFKMKEIIQNQSNNSWIEARDNGKTLRKEETDIIKQLTDYAEKERGKPITYPLYSTYTQMTNKYLQFIVDVKEGTPIRDLSGIRDLGFIGIVDDRVKNCIIDGMNRKLPYKEVYKYCKEEIIKLCEMLDFKPKDLLN